MQFSSRDLTDQYISSSYQDVVQQYVPTGSTLYFLDGYGNVILGITSASYGNTVITTADTASFAVSASYAISTSYETFFEDSSSHAEIADLALVADVALLADTASISVLSESSSFLINNQNFINKSLAIAFSVSL